MKRLLAAAAAALVLAPAMPLYAESLDTQPPNVRAALEEMIDTMVRQEGNTAVERQERGAPVAGHLVRPRQQAPASDDCHCTPASTSLAGQPVVY